MKYLVLGLTIGATTVAAAAQLTRTPAPAPGITRVAGEVSITNEPVVLARQEGGWSVTCIVPPDAGPFVNLRTRYTIVFADGTPEEHVEPLETRQDGWIRVNGDRWINLASAMSVEREP